MHLSEVIYNFVYLFRGILEIFHYFLYAFRDIFMNFWYFFDIAGRALYKVAFFVIENDVDFSCLIFDAVDVTDKAHRIEVFFHFLHFLRRSR